MCGICGVIRASAGGLETAEAPAASRAATMLAALAHRGPDDAGTRAADGAVLGATRLAIRGVHQGRQPLVDRESGVMAVCNGEIDNHRELRAWLEGRGVAIDQATDVAVIPGLYRELGEAFVERLIGVFALAVWDPARRLLLLARDRAGEKPLFFTHDGSEVVFASEVAALRAGCPAGFAIDRVAIAQYLRFGCFLSPTSPLAGVAKVGPGERVVFADGSVRRERYWRWRSAPRARPTLDDMDEAFRRAVERQSDVEARCGVFLSGGLDSSLVTAVLRSVRPQAPLDLYTLRFDEPSYDEGGFADSAARAVGLETHAVWVKAEALPRWLSELVGNSGEPLADPAWLPAAMLAQRAAEDVRVVLVGEGGDELFGGYPTYLGSRLAGRYARWPAPVRRLIAAAVRALPPSDRKVTLGFLLKRFVDGAALAPGERHLLWTANLPPALLAELGGGAAPLRVPDASLPELDAAQLHDLETTLAEGLLTKADRASMNFALELRAPFLDRDVMELAAGLDGEDRISGFTTKAFLKRYAERYLPRAIVYRRKRGLSVPLARWLRGPLRDWARGRLDSPRLADVGIARASALALFDQHDARRGDHARALWTLLVLAEWLDSAAAQPAAASPPASRRLEVAR